MPLIRKNTHNRIAHSAKFPNMQNSLAPVPKSRYPSFNILSTKIEPNMHLDDYRNADGRLNITNTFCTKQ